MGWIAEWAARSYAQLYLAFGKEPFEFADASSALHISQPKLSRLIQELEGHGFLFNQRLAVDRRKRHYYLVSPEQAVHALGLLADTNGDLEAKLRAVRGSVPYVLTGGAAAYKYHRYSRAAKADIRIAKQDLGFWVALLREPKSKLSIDGYTTERGHVAIDLHTDLTQAAAVRAIEIDEITTEAPEELLGFLLRSGNDSDVLDALAILITRADGLDWDRLARSDLRQEVGFLLEATNHFLDNQLFEVGTLGKFRREPALTKQLGTRRTEHESLRWLVDLADQWGLELKVSPRIIRKAVEDLIP